MSSLNPYSSELVSISWGGLSMSAGLSEGTFAMFTRNNDNVSEHVGADGQLTLTTIPDKTGTFDLECAQQSPTNHLLSAVQAEFDINRTVRRANMVLADPSGGGLVFAQKAYIKKPADFGYAAEEQTNRTWMFGCERLVYVSAPRGAVASITQAEQAILDQINSIQPDFSPL